MKSLGVCCELLCSTLQGIFGALVENRWPREADQRGCSGMFHEDRIRTVSLLWKNPPFHLNLNITLEAKGHNVLDMFAIICNLGGNELIK